MNKRLRQPPFNHTIQPAIIMEPNNNITPKDSPPGFGEALLSDRPVRVQRKRTKGWKKPENTINVSRPSKWGNPFSWQEEAAQIAATASYAVLSSPIGRRLLNEEGKKNATEKYKRALLSGKLSVAVNEVKKELKGKNLMCWCTSNEHCHADILIEVANS